MEAVKRSRFATKQMRAGPAPLASFEDLPSDELESPEDFPHEKGYICNIDDDSSRDLQFTTPDTLTVSSQSTPRIESDFDSHFTLTPGDSYQGQSTSDLRTASLSSLSKEESTLSVKQKKGSAVSLGTLEATEAEYTHRKTSWTDIFRSHNQNSAKTSTPVISQLGPREKSSKKKCRNDNSKKSSGTKSKEKGKFLSIFKKRSNKQSNSPVTPDNCILPIEKINNTESPTDTLPDGLSKINNIKISKGKENELPVNKEKCLSPSEIQNDLGKSNSDHCDKIPDERKLSRKVINITENTVEKEFNIIPKVEEKHVDKTPKMEDIQTVIVKDDIESSESDLTIETESKDLPVEKKEDDFEAETLLPHDLSEIEDDPVIELQPVTFEISSQVVIPSRQQRLEITTKSIDRPRSTTPINVAPLEAFIRSVSPTFDSKVDKIKLSLPGEQFVGRVKSPKKSSVKSWADFCEHGLHSPRIYKRIDKDNNRNPFESSDDILHTCNARYSSSENWAAFESDFATLESNVFGDNLKSDFDDIPELAKDVNEPYQYFESNFSYSSSSSVVDKCVSCSKVSNFELNNAQSVNQPLSCDGCCSCQCHSKQKSLKSPESCTNMDTFGASNAFSLVTDEQF